MDLKFAADAGICCGGWILAMLAGLWVFHKAREQDRKAGRG
jgi:hypothetical protein